MNLEDFVDTLEIAASKYLWKLRIPAKTDKAVKARIQISDNIYVQFYFHQFILESVNFILRKGGFDAAFETLKLIKITEKDACWNSFHYGPPASRDRKRNFDRYFE